MSHAPRERAIAEDLAAVQTRLSRAGFRRGLPLLANLRIASPCDQSWDDMQLGEDARSRHCLACKKSVYDIASMTAEEAEEFLRVRIDPCVQLYRRHDGTIITRQDCSVGVTRATRTRLRRGALAVAAAGASVLCAVAVAAIPPEPITMSGPRSLRDKVPSELVPTVQESPEPTIRPYPHPLRGAPPPMPPPKGAHR